MHAIKLDVHSVTIDEVFFQDGGKRPIRPLTEEEWGAIPFQDPPQFVATALNLFQEINQVGTYVISALLQLRYLADKERALKYYIVRRFSVYEIHFQNHKEQQTLSQLIAGKRSVPDHMIVVLADVLGIPEETFKQRASTGRDRYLRHKEVRRLDEESATAQEQAPLETLRDIFGDLPLRYQLSTVRMLEIAKRMKAALPPDPPSK